MHRSSRKRKRTLSFLLLLLTGGLIAAGCGAPPVPTALPATPTPPPPTPVPEGMLSPDDLDAFDFVIERKIEAVPLAGVALGIDWGDNEAYVQGYGYANLATVEPVSGDTVFQIASLTKQFTAAAIMQLVDRGEVALDDPVGRFYPDAPASWQGVTVHHLLSHTSGIPDVADLVPADLSGDLTNPTTPQELVAALHDAPLSFEPGTKFRYGSSGYRLLAGIVAEVTGMPAEAYYREHLFEPLGLDSTLPCYTDYERIAQGYSIVAGQLEPVIAHDPVQGVGPSGLCSSAADLLVWQQALVSGEVVSPESYRKMTTPIKLEGGEILAYGYGLGVAPDAVAHGGSLPGFRSWLAYYPDEDLTIVLLSNTDIPAAYSLDILGDVIAGRILGKD
ncbi:MAG: serine hydrolase domain-containing protein [Anaerolineae bacterium]